MANLTINKFNKNITTVAKSWERDVNHNYLLRILVKGTNWRAEYYIKESNTKGDHVNFVDYWFSDDEIKRINESEENFSKSVPANLI